MERYGRWRRERIRFRFGAAYSVSTTLGVMAGAFLAGGALQLTFAVFCLLGMLYVSALSTSALCDFAANY
ncbi:hypothetical protein [Actinoplanes sp. NBRC 101535]|uniref:hypothetical protein n=1 Tax=Actinoplanes sp. NBRC 101535 TaxID=3032196 RepID=UPI002554925E|nr:hypothetical protein [Actinoplanes sp. NBRC 101535]